MKKLPIYQINKFYCESSENDLYFNDFKSHLIDNSFIENSHSHNFYLLVLFTQGSGVHVIDFDSFEIKIGSLYFLKPGQVHSWKLSEDIDGYIAFYSQEVYNLHFGKKKLEEYSFYRTLMNRPELLLTELQILEFKQYFDMLIYENRDNKLKKSDKLLNVLDIIHIEIDRIYNSIDKHSVHQYNFKINELKELVDSHYKEEKAPSYYANKMNISLKHLNRICKDVLNITLTEFIYRKIILESKRLLSIKGMTISDVANEFGFENYSYFTKVFKKYTGMTPQNFKKNI
ncbi:AraC-type DNA-binding protein [Flavobacterium swingsii]|uniref:AraC-type DNA-binding protein n=1 Tax=Flavobacterium swingsii TaxID=498292 RepID=A0A1I0ZT68_9FLAO|nr:helix-turn-helix domain-containing protein [Flavobacterium swingsii]SFB28855.1 AraC-type DNA-binding protein [Flavobacterium swingsii]